MPPRTAVQLYSFGPIASDDWAPIFEAIAESGLRAIETVNVPTGDPATTRRLAATRDLTILSAHTSVCPTRMDGLADRIAAIAEMGAGWVFTPALVPEDLADGDALARTIDVLGEANELCRRHGIRFGIHNHEHEMAELDGIPIYRRLLDGLDESVGWQLDVYWATAGGVAPADAIAAIGTRLVSLHLKDGSGRRDDPNVVLGRGSIDILGSLVAVASMTGVESAIIEFDAYEGDVTSAVAASVAYLEASAR